MNFVNVLKVTFDVGADGVRTFIHYTAEIKAVSAAAVGILTGGISLLVGVGTGAKHVTEAEGLVRR